MGLKENLKAKIHLDTLLRKIMYTIKEPPETRWVDKHLLREILDMTDFVYKKAGTLDLYIHHPEDENVEVLVLDNELPVYHTTVADVVLRKNPHWQQVFSIRNIKKIMNDRDVVVSRGKESIKRLHANAIERLDLTYTRDDLGVLVEDAAKGLERGSVEQLWESLNLFFELLGFQPVYFQTLEPGLHLFGRPSLGRGAAPTFEHLLIFNEKALSIQLKKGPFSTNSDSDNDWVVRYAKGWETADLQGIAVFEFLTELALEQPHHLPRTSSELQDELPVS